MHAPWPVVLNCTCSSAWNRNIIPGIFLCRLDEKMQIITKREVDEGEELTIHYGLFETEASLHFGLDCLCGTTSCQGTLLFDNYRYPPGNSPIPLLILPWGCLSSATRWAEPWTDLLHPSCFTGILDL